MIASVWTQDRIDRLRTLWLQGRTAEQVARALGADITRSAVLGKVHRLGLSAGRPAPPVKRPVQPRPLPPARPLPLKAVAKTRSRIPTPEDVPVRETGLATLLSVGRRDCRWPMGDPRAEGFSLCGLKAVRGAYCARHGAIAYRPAPENRRGLEFVLRLD
ncbi:GcrA family cell cycle regulator [Brevundimonas goettingensis]|uniref:GcrA cell cycle regulator n=1 Tax=Brevundimonas goettingensis TaxID=2774190 RepID=A0A975C3I2_9CAUL|nr:GcrA family cell cycle regulator [Brevundimonas goettingensis]QTC92825.1 GcrA cell cycle regulator [Brevundimonas goettingensis]